MADDRALVKNAADPRQVGNAAKKEKQARELELADLRELLSTESGRRFVWRVMGYCKFGSDIWDPSSRIHFLAGLQHVGNWLLAEVTAADEEAFFVMMRESQARSKKQMLEAEAAQTKRAEERDTDGDN
jgi:hypothetical protein